jgi:hypothetical protein
MQHFPVSLQGNSGAFALLSHRPAVAAVIFVHGFFGDPRTTWVDFAHLVDQVPIWTECDLFFYAYRSRNQITPLAEEFGHFLTNIAGAKEQAVISSRFFAPSSKSHTLFSTPLWENRRNAPYNYLILVGHSTGAIIIREVMRQKITRLVKSKGDLGAWMQTGKDEKEDPDYPDRLVLRSSLRFFAPAHLGVLAAGKLGLAQSLPIIGKITGAFLRSSPLYQNLRHDSPTILELKKATEELWKQYKFGALKGSSLFGANEEIVYIGGYSHDEVDPTLGGHDHISICKPRPDYVKPLEFVIHASSTGKSA